MIRRWANRVAALCAVLLSMNSAIAAQAEAGGDGARYAALLDNIDLLVDNYSRYLGTKYGLNNEQDAYTRQMLREKTYAFLERHEDGLRDVVETMFAVRTGADMTPEELQGWGKHVLPIYEDARKLIEEGNQDWREILTDEQKAMHDQDVELMHKSLATTEDQLQRIVSGDMTVDEFRNPRRYRNRAPRDAGDGTPALAGNEAGANDVIRTPRNRTARGIVRPDEPAGGPGDQPQPAVVAELPPDQQEAVLEGDAPVVEPLGDGEPQPEDHAEPMVEHPGQPGIAPDAEPGPDAVPPADPTPRSGRSGPKVAAGADFEGKWDQYVREFVERYQLDDQQKQQAQSILDDCKSQGRRLIRGKQTLLEQLDRRAAELRAEQARDGNKKRGEELNTIENKRRGVFEPLNQIFENSLKPRLDKLPTRAQRKVAEESAKPKARPAPDKPAERPADRPKRGGGAP